MHCSWHVIEYLVVRDQTVYIIRARLTVKSHWRLAKKLYTQHSIRTLLRHDSSAIFERPLAWDKPWIHLDRLFGHTSTGNIYTTSEDKRRICLGCTCSCLSTIAVRMLERVFSKHSRSYIVSLERTYPQLDMVDRKFSNTRTICELQFENECFTYWRHIFFIFGSPLCTCQCSMWLTCLHRE